jgi:hypothetical protein
MTEALKKYRVLYAVTLSEYYEIEAESEDAARELAYQEGQHVDKHGEPCERGKVVEAVDCEAEEVKGGSDALSKSDLCQFTGTEQWYRHQFVRKVLFTDGVKYVADKVGAYWLIDEIALSQEYESAVESEEFQCWKLKVNQDHTATLTCEDGNGNAVYTKPIPFTDFPMDEIQLYYTNNTLLLPSEY